MKTGIATVSIAGDLPEKLAAIAAAGFDGVEIFEQDFIAHDGGPAEVGAGLVSRAGVVGRVQEDQALAPRGRACAGLVEAPHHVRQVLPLLEGALQQVPEHRDGLDDEDSHGPPGSREV